MGLLQIRSFHEPSVHRHCIAYLQICVVSGLLVGSLPAAESPTPLPVRVTSEIVPAGGTAQIKLFVDSPSAVTSGSVKATFDPAVFDTVRFVSVFSATGDAFGSAEPKDNTVSVLFQSPSGGLGRAPDLPVLTIQVPVRAGVPTGISSVPQLSASNQLWSGLAGQSFTPRFSPASITIGDTLSVARLHPGAGLLPTGTAIAVDGTGFKPGIIVRIEGVASNPAVFVDSTHLRVSLLAPADLRGKHVSVYNPGQAAVDFYPDLQGVVDDAVKFVQPIFPRQQFLSSTFGGFVLGPNSAAVQNTNSEPVDLTFHTEILNNPSLDRKVTLAPGATLVIGYGVISSNINRASLYLLASLPVSAVRIVAYPEGIQTFPVTPISVAPPSQPRPPRHDPTALEFVAIQQKAPPLAQSAGAVSCASLIASLVTDRGGNWLSTAIEVDSFTQTPFVTVKVDASNLDVGIYRGGFVIACPEVSMERQIQVVLRVAAAAPQLMSDKQTISASVPAVSELATATFTVSAEGLPAEFLVTSDSPWLTVEQPALFPNPPVPYRFTAPQTVVVAFSSAQLAAGTYRATLSITPVISGLAVSLNVQVDFTVASSVPRPKPGPPLPVAVVNAASGISGPIAAGEIVTIFGLNLGPDFPYAVADADGSSPPAEVGGTAILFDGIPGPILFSSPTQVNVIVPPALGVSTKAVAIEAEHAGVRGHAGSYPLVSAAPGIFSIENQDGSRNTPASPAPAGSTVRVFVTGIAFAPIAFLIGDASSVSLPATYTGSAAGQFAGQVTFSLPSDFPPGGAELLLAVDYTGLRAAHFRLFVKPQS